MNPFQMLGQLRNLKNPQAMIDNMIGNDPQKQQAWKITQELLNNGGSKQEILQKACKQSGMNVDDVVNTINSFGIKF